MPCGRRGRHPDPSKPIRPPAASMSRALLPAPARDRMMRPTGPRHRRSGPPRVTSRRRSSSPSRCCAATGAATAPSPKAPARSTAPYLTPEQVLAIARRRRPPAATRRSSPWARAPRLRYPVAGRGSPSTATPRRSTTSPPWPARARRDRPAPPRQRRRARSPTSWPPSGRSRRSQGMMVESLRDDLGRPPRAPDKTPARRWPPSRRRASSPSRSPPASSWASARTAPTGSRRWRRSPPATAATGTCRR